MKTKRNFTDSEFVALCDMINGRFPVRFNKCGNITVEARGEFWTLYCYPDKKYLWRHIDPATGYAHPLNMKNRKNTTPIYYTNYDGTPIVYNYYSIDNCKFNTFNEALEYFNDYIIKYHKVF